MTATMRNYYYMMEIERTASIDEIKKAYHRLMFKYHPDRCKDSDATEMARFINEMYITLKDPVARRDYDRKLEESVEEETTPEFKANEEEYSFVRIWATTMYPPNYPFMVGTIMNEFKTGNVKGALNLSKEWVMYFVITGAASATFSLFVKTILSQI